jgi:predicted DNA-binding antitoxin AbrB/MazE fold protein
MMDRTVDAVYEHGGFRVLNPTPLQLAEGQQVRLIIEGPTENSNFLLDLAAQVYDGLSSEDVDAIERIALDRHDFFGEAKQS